MSQRSFAFTENCSATVLSEPWASHCDCKPEHTEMACVSSWMSGKETSTKKLYFHKEKDWLDAVVTAENLSYLFLMEVLHINWFSMVPIHHDPDSTIRRKVTRKKQVKFVSLLNVLFICLFQLYFKFSYWSLYDIYEFVTAFSEWIWTFLLISESRSEDATLVNTYSMAIYVILHL